MKLTKFTFALACASLAALAQAPAPRLLCIFLDLNALTASEVEAARTQAIDFVERQATPADQIAIMTYTSRVNVLQDFTMDHDRLVSVIRGILPGEVSAPDQAALLKGMRALAGILGNFPQKKTVLYPPTSIPGAGNDLPDMQATVRSLMEANIALYPLDLARVPVQVK